MNTIASKQIKPNSLNPISLAFLGDAVYEILVREHLLTLGGNRPPEELHRLAVNYVSARAQTKAMELIAPLLTENELNAFKRGRNAHVSHIPKGASVAQYHTATGFEALFGYLHLTEQTDRLDALFNTICEGLDNV